MERVDFREISRREFTDCSGWEPIFLEVRLLHSGFPFQVDRTTGLAGNQYRGTFDRTSIFALHVIIGTAAMKLTPWLRSLKTGLSRVFQKANVQRRKTRASHSPLIANGAGAEELEDRIVLFVDGYFTPNADGIYAQGVLLQSPASPIPMEIAPDGLPGIRIVVRFENLTTINIAGGRPFINFNTFSLDPNAPNYEGQISSAVYLGPGVVNAGEVDFWYHVQNGENTPGPLQPDPVLKVVSGGNGGAAVSALICH